MKPAVADQPHVTVVGAGLAGMTAALRLRQLGCQVNLVEAAQSLGGKAGARLLDGSWEDHGLHIALRWYRNFLGVLDEIGARHNFTQVTTGHLLTRHSTGMRARFGTIPKFVCSTLRRPVAPRSDAILWHYSVIDLICHQSARQAPGHDRPISEFLNSRWYMTPPARHLMEHFVQLSQASSTRVASTRAWAAMFAALFARPAARGDWRHLVYMPASDLESALISPFRDKLERLGVSITTGWRLTSATAEGDRVATVSFDASSRRVTREVDQLLLAVPHHALGDIDGNALEIAELTGPKAHRFQSLPLSALRLCFRRRLPGVPAEHVILFHSPYRISLVQAPCSRHASGVTCLDLAISAPGALLGISAAEVVAVIVEELRYYIPSIRPDDVARARWQPHDTEPMFIADVGWSLRRPSATTKLGNLFLAGDYVASFVDLPTMEGAVVAGTLAADAIRQRLRPSAKPLRILYPNRVDPRVAAAMKWLLSPIAAAAYAISPSRRGQCPDPTQSSPKLNSPTAQ